jgi:hypothetical protein
MKIKILLRKLLLKDIGFVIEKKILPKFDLINKHSKKKIAKYTFGKKNPKINFYVIKRTPGAGFFSNLLYVLINLEIADKKNFTPIVDMYNFPTMYNQNKNINNLNNIWELFFKKTSNYNLRTVYNSKNVYFSPNKLNFKLFSYKSKNLRKIFDKYVQINVKILDIIEKFTKKNFGNKKVLGVHLRGTDQKLSANHAHPPSIYEIQDLIDEKIKKFKYEKIFLLTEELNYHIKLKKRFGSKICSYSFFRANNIEDFSSSNRKNHRNRLGIESLIEGITLSQCNEIIYCETNISLFAIFYSKFKIKKNHINHGIKSKNRLISSFSWYFKILIPHFFKNEFIKFLRLFFSSNNINFKVKDIKQK